MRRLAASLRSSPGGRKRPALALIAAVALVVVVAIGLGQAGGKDGGEAAKAPPFDLKASLRTLAQPPKPPPALARLYKQASALLSGGSGAFHARLRTLRGHPVVVNKWASWCSPCRAEFPVFQQVATARGKQVAFLGLDANDKAPAAEQFLSARPLPYPSYQDPGQKLSRTLQAPDVAPVTIFLDAKGKTAFIHSGQYTSARQLSGDIDRYLG
ncbi:MAG: cytochrome c biosis protein CcmG, thiol:disulfide interchange protein DsbE [Solirubrobacteraceae bacterium]|jgi:cytochrome c biogenesis protein CcmG/thiol:disulfide interchange protein DsbE|nr:cytochrome c biosis protein CcmG, thiol:disulfide interchange protein DsbE [Solirubrobacteraceae bacterium]